MIEKIRKYPAVILCALVAVIIGFVFMDTQNLINRGGQAYIKVGSTSYYKHEFDKLGPSARRLCSQLTSYQSMTMYEFMMSMIDRKAESAEAAEKSFFTNRMILQKASIDMGIEAGDAEIDRFIKERSVFTDPQTKTFNAVEYKSFIDNNLGKMGMTERDLRLLVRDVISYEKIAELLAGGLDVPTEFIKDSQQARNQKVTASYVTLSLNDYEKSITPTDEEIKTYWEEHKDGFTTEDRRKFSYLIATPSYPAGAEKKPELPKAAKEGEAPPAPSEADQKINEERRKADLKVASSMDDFMLRLEDSKGKDFEQAAKEMGWSLKSSDFFTATTLPADLAGLKPRKTTKTVANLLFELKSTEDPLSFFTASFPVDEANWLIARLDGEEAIRTKTYEEAKELAKAQLIKDRAKQAMIQAADELNGKISASLKANKSIADIAKEQNVTFKNIGPIGLQDQPSMGVDQTALFQAAQYTNPGELTEVIKKDAICYIVLVNKREIVKDEKPEETLKQMTDQAKTGFKFQAFQAWISEQNSNASNRGK